MNKLKESILNDGKKGDRDTFNASIETTNSSNETASSTNTATNPTASTTTRQNDTYVYGVGVLAVLGIGVWVFFAYNTYQPKNKKIVNKKQDKPSKRHHIP